MVQLDEVIALGDCTYIVYGFTAVRYTKDMESIQPFDFARMFIGEHPPLFLLEVVFRTAVMYGYTLLAVRFLGKRGTGQLSVFDFIVVILLGSAAGDPMLYDDVPLLYGIVVITVVVVIERAINAWSNRNRTVEKLLESTPTILINEGKVLDDALSLEEISRPELMMELREKGIRSTGEVERMYMEPSGQMSVFRFEKGKEREGESTFPEQ